MQQTHRHRQIHHSSRSLQIYPSSRRLRLICWCHTDGLWGSRLFDLRGTNWLWKRKEEEKIGHARRVVDHPLSPYLCAPLPFPFPQQQGRCEDLYYTNDTKKIPTETLSVENTNRVVLKPDYLCRNFHGSIWHIRTLRLSNAFLHSCAP